MTIEQVIERLRTMYRKPRGKTATPGHKNYEAAKDVDFVQCKCAEKAGSAYVEYIGRSKRGTVHSVGCFGKITVGRKSFHFNRGTRPCV
jgi:hypothetical protein